LSCFHERLLAHPAIRADLSASVWAAPQPQLRDNLRLYRLPSFRPHLRAHSFARSRSLAELGSPQLTTPASALGDAARTGVRFAGHLRSGRRLHSRPCRPRKTVAPAVETTHLPDGRTPANTSIASLAERFQSADRRHDPPAPPAVVNPIWASRQAALFQRLFESLYRCKQNVDAACPSISSVAIPAAINTSATSSSWGNRRQNIPFRQIF